MEDSYIAPSREEFTRQLYDFMKARGTPIGRLPQLGHKEIDLYFLYNEVVSRGGVEEVISKKLWKDIINNFHLPDTCTNAGYTLRVHYLKFLFAYERKFYHGLEDELTPQELEPSTAFKKGSLKSGTPTAPKIHETRSYHDNQQQQQQNQQPPEQPNPLVPFTNKVSGIAKGPPKSLLHIQPNPTQIQINDATKTVTQFRSANYLRTSVPNQSNRIKTVPMDILIQKKITTSLESQSSHEIDWALNYLVSKSYETDIVLKPIYKLIDLLLEQFQAAASVLLPVLGHSSYLQLYDIYYKDKLIIEKLFTIFINLSFVQENEKYLATHTLFLNSILNFLYGKEELVYFALQIVANIANCLVLNENYHELISYLFGYLYDEDMAYTLLSLEAFSKLSQIPQNHYWLAKLDLKFYQRLEELLFVPDTKIQVSILTLLSNIAQYSSMKAKVQLAQTTTLVKHLVYLLNQFIAQDETLKQQEMDIENETSDATTELEQCRTFITKIVNTLLYLAAEMKNNPIFLPYEEHLLELSLTTTDEDYGQLLNDLCVEIMSR